LLVSMGCLGDLHHKKMGDLAAQKTVVGFDGLFGRLALRKKSETCKRALRMGSLQESPMKKMTLALRKKSETCKRALKTGDLPYEKMETCKRAL